MMDRTHFTEEFRRAMRFVIQKHDRVVALEQDITQYGSQEMLDAWLTPMGVILRGGGLDEAPQAYRRLPDVLTAQGPTIEVVHTLTPIVVCMAGANEFDPYKD